MSGLENGPYWNLNNKGKPAKKKVDLKSPENMRKIAGIYSENRRKMSGKYPEHVQKMYRKCPENVWKIMEKCFF